MAPALFSLGVYLDTCGPSPHGQLPIAPMGLGLWHLWPFVLGHMHQCVSTEGLFTKKNQTRCCLGDFCELSVFVRVFANTICEFTPRKSAASVFGAKCTKARTKRTRKTFCSDFVAMGPDL